MLALIYFKKHCIKLEKAPYPPRWRWV